jgi:hypothetical protein
MIGKIFILMGMMHMEYVEHYMIYGTVDILFHTSITLVICKGAVSFKFYLFYPWGTQQIGGWMDPGHSVCSYFIDYVLAYWKM